MAVSEESTIRNGARMLRILQGTHPIPDLRNGRNTDEDSSLSEEVEFYDPEFDLSDIHSGPEPRNPDTFYTKIANRSPNLEVPHSLADDSAYQYFTIGTASDRRYSNNSERKATPELEPAEGRMTSLQAFRLWEQHDAVTKREITPDGDEVTGVIDNVHNGGLYEPFRPGLTALATEDPLMLLTLPPAAKYRDLLKLVPIGARAVDGLESSRKCKNNLATVSHSGSDDYLVVCCRSEVLVYGFDRQLQMPEKSPALRFDTRPQFTSTADRILLTWPYYPHTINSIRSTADWIRGPAIGICTDDGSVLVWYTATISSEADRLKSVAGNQESKFYGLKIAADVNLKMDSSAWGLDFASATDSLGEKHHILAASANSQTATLFYHDNGRFCLVNTHQVLHNIPEVSFVLYTIEGNKHTAFLSCASISSELLLFQFTFTVGEKVEKEDVARQLGRVLFDEPVVVRRTNLDSDCWTTKPVQASYFKPVQSLRAMTGDPFIDDDVESSQIQAESVIMGMAPDPQQTANLGPAAAWQFFDSPVVCLASSEQVQQQDEDTSKFVSVDEEYRRIHQYIKLHCRYGSDLATRPLEDTFLAVSTESRTGLFRADTLFCTAGTKQLFNLDIPENDETKWCNRISISQVIPELLCFIAVTQLGLVTIMRLCEHRGLHGMRQEHLFPNVLSLAVGESTLRTITGLAVRDMSVLPEHPRFFLYLTYSDGLTVTYEVMETADEILDVEF